jgi:hypothetical protein
MPRRIAAIIAPFCIEEEISCGLISAGFFERSVGVSKGNGVFVGVRDSGVISIRVGSIVMVESAGVSVSIGE